MKNEILIELITQVKKYELTKYFNNIEEFKKWALELNNTQISNFLSLDIDLEKIRNLRHLLINCDLLNCKDYKEKVAAISSLKNGGNSYHLFNSICSLNFLKSKNFYKDIDMLSKADTARYGLWILGEDAFINSPYHDEDLKLIVETHDTKEEDPLDFVVSDALATVAGNIDSIKSPYHRADMKLIATSGSDCLQISSSYPKYSLNNLAIDKVSLLDKYHLENMQILSMNLVANEFLYIIMTDPNFISSKYYRKEVEALVNAKSKITARALYYYIVNPERKYLSDPDFLSDFDYDFINNPHILSLNSVAGSTDPDYLKNLVRINDIDDKFVMHFVSLLMNPDFINSPYKDFDLELLQSISNKSIFMDLYMLMRNYKSLRNKHHKNDVVIISQTTSEGIRDLMLEKACNIHSLKSINHEFDMEFISKLDLDNISEKIYFEMQYYLFSANGLNDPKHREKLEQLVCGIMVERNDILDSFDSLESILKDDMVSSSSTSRLKNKIKSLKLSKKI